MLNQILPSLTLSLLDSRLQFSLIPYSSVVDAGMCSGILVSFRLEQSTTFDSQRHLGGHTGSLLQALFRRVSSVPEHEKKANTYILITQNDISLVPIPTHTPRFPVMFLVTHLLPPQLYVSSLSCCDLRSSFLN